MPRGGPMETEDPAVQTARVLIRLARLLNVRLRENPRGTGLALSEQNVLAGIDRGYDRPSVLARNLMLDMPRVSRIVERLHEDGYVRREVDPLDRRMSRLSLTPEGVAFLAQARAEVNQAMSNLLGGLTDEE